MRKFRRKQLQSHYEEGFLIYEEMRKYLVLFKEAVSHIWLCNRSRMNFVLYEENLIFFFISVVGIGRAGRTSFFVSLTEISNFVYKFT